MMMFLTLGSGWGAGFGGGGGVVPFRSISLGIAIVPSTNSAWVLREVPTPEPGPNQILIKIRASGMCYTDVHQTHGGIPGTFPRTLGHEPVGEIVAVGPGVTTRKIGDRRVSASLSCVRR